jgi:hypothetical protein
MMGWQDDAGWRGGRPDAGPDEPGRWRRWGPSQDRGQADGVTVPPLSLDQSHGFLKRVAGPAVQKHVPELGAEAFNIRVLPRAVRLDGSDLGSDRRDPVPDGPSHEQLGVVEAAMPGHAALQHNSVRGLEDPRQGGPPTDPDSQSLAGELIVDTERVDLRLSPVRPAPKS